MPRKTFASVQEVKDFAAANPEKLIVLFGNKDVLDLTEFADIHPGGPDVLQEFAGGQDCKQGFVDACHSESASMQMMGFKIGSIQA